MMDTDPAARPFRWIGAMAVLGVVSAALAVLAWEAVDDSITFIGDGKARSDAIILADDEAGSSDPGAVAEAGDSSSEAAPAEGSGDAAEEPADPPPATYTVQPGDTGTRIARELFGRQEVWSEIAEFNDLEESATLRVGQVLRIPDL